MNCLRLLNKGATKFLRVGDAGGGAGNRTIAFLSIEIVAPNRCTGEVVYYLSAAECRELAKWLTEKEKQQAAEAAGGA